MESHKRIIMDFKFIQGGLKPNESVQSPAIERKLPIPETGIGRASRVAESQIPNAIDVLLSSPKSYQQLTSPSKEQFLASFPEVSPEQFKQYEDIAEQSRILPKRGEITEKIEKKLGREKGYYKPRSIPEKVLQGITSEVLPMAIFSPTTLGANLLRSTASNVSAGVTEELGGGPFAQFLVGSLSGVGMDFIRKGGRPGQLRKVSEQEMDKDYAQARKAAPTLIQDATAYESGLQKELEILDSGKSGLKKPDIVRGKINVQKAWDTKVHLNKLYKKESDYDAANFYKRVVGNINENVLQKADQSFLKPFNRAEDLHIGLKAPSALRKALLSIPKVQKIVDNPKAQFILSLATGVPGLLFGGKLGYGIAAGIPATLGANWALKTFDLFYKSKEARDLLNQVGEAAISANKSNLALNLRRFNDEINNLDKSNVSPQRKIEPKKQSDFKFLQGGLKNS
jgi:hypothetical protein